MANRYWVGGTANWDGTAGSKWATTSGGAGGAAVPTIADDVFFDAASGAVVCTVTATANVKSLNCTGYTGTLHQNAVTLTSAGAVTFVTGMTYSYTGAAVIAITLSGAALTGANKSFHTVTFTNGPHYFVGSSTFVNLNFTGLAADDQLTYTNGATWTVTGTITVVGVSDAVRSHLRGSADATIGTPGLTVALGATGAAVLSHVSFTDVAFTGTNTPVAGSRVGDMGNNSGITFAASATRYWVGGTGSWSDATNHWAASSGGAPGTANYPLPQDTAVFNAASFSADGSTLTMDRNWLCAINFAAIDQTVTIAVTSSFVGVVTFGNITWSSLLTGPSVNRNWWAFSPTQTLNFGAGSVGSFSLSLIRPGQVADLAGNWSSATWNLFLSAGTLNCNGYDMTCYAFYLHSGAAPRTLNMGSGTFTAHGADGTRVWGADNAALTVNPGASTIVFSRADTNPLGAHFGGKTYNNLTIAGNATGAVTAHTAGTFNVITIGVPRTYNVASGQTLTAASVVRSGGATAVATIQSGTAGAPFTIAKSGGGVMSLDYLSLKDSAATPASTWYAGQNSTNVSGNSGWIFTGPPQALSPSSIASVESISVATVLRGAVTIQPSSIASAEAIAAATILRGAVVLAPASIASAEAVSAPTLLCGAVIVQPASIASAQAFGAAVVIPGAVIVEPASIGSAESFGVASLILQFQILVGAGGISSGESFPVATMLGTAVFPGIIILPSLPVEPEPTWRQFLFDTRTMDDLGELDMARDRNLNVQLNRAGSGNLSVGLEEEIASLIEQHRTGIRWVRDDKDVWAGPVWTLNEDLASNKLMIGCLGWFEELEHRIVRAGQEEQFNLEGQDLVIYALLAMANGQRDGLPRKNSDGTNGTGVLRPSKIIQGVAASNGSFPDISIAFQRGQKIGDQIRGITGNENGCDIKVHPTERTLDLFYPRLGMDTDVVLVFGDDMIGENLENLVRDFDGNLTNRFTVFGDNGSVGLAEDTDSMDYWGVMFEDESSVSGLATSTSARDFAGAEVAVLKDPKITFSVTPMGTPPDEEDSPIPILFKHFDIGDTLTGRGERGRAVIDQRIRVFGAALQVDDNDNEKVTSLDLAPPG